MMKKVRMLLRVSSNQQLEADGDLTVQRDIVKDYILKHDDWYLDKKEYFEGGVSGYKNAVADRDVLQEALIDAQKHEYDILVVYKDDRIGRRMWEIGAYVMQLKGYGVDIYTTKDGCISPDNNDIMGQMMLALRYGNAQKSSADTGQRVKDTAQKLVKQGKFMGGKAPYGYELVLSGELSKHGRALHKLKIIPEQAEVVRKIYQLSFDKEFGSSKIALELNNDSKYKRMAPNDYWKSGTITSILTNPIYCGITAYKRRERTNGKYHRLGSDEWIYAETANEEIKIIDSDMWNKVQVKRSNRSIRYNAGALKAKGVNVIVRNDGMLPLIDVAYCGYCGAKLTNGSKYSYWTIKGTGEKRASKLPIYKCPSAWSGVPHDKNKMYRADNVDDIVFRYITQYMVKLQNDSKMYEQVIENNRKEREQVHSQILKCEQELKKIKDDIELMKSHLPEAIEGTYPVSLKNMEDAIEIFNKKQSAKESELEDIKAQYDHMQIDSKDLDELYDMIPTWTEIFEKADKETKRVLINKIVDKVIIKKDKITIKFKINLDDFNSPHDPDKVKIEKHYRNIKTENKNIQSDHSVYTRFRVKDWIASVLAMMAFSGHVA